MSKRTVKLTESELKKVITESVKKVLTEIYENNTEDYIFYIEPHKCNNLGKVLKEVDYSMEGLGAYNNEPLCDIPNLAFWLSYASDRFAAVTEDGEVYTLYHPDFSVGNLNTDTLYFVHDKGQNNAWIGNGCGMLEHSDGTYTLFRRYGGIYKGIVRKESKEYIFIGTQLREDYE